METLKIIGIGNKLLMVKDDTAKYMDLGGIFSSKKQEFLFSVFDISHVEIKRPGALSSGSIQICGENIAPSLQNNIFVSFNGDDNYKIALLIQQHINSKFLGRKIQSKRNRFIEERLAEQVRPKYGDLTDFPTYSIFQELERLFPQTDLVPGNYRHARQSIHAFISLAADISPDDFDAMLNYEKRAEGKTLYQGHSVFGRFTSYENIVSHLNWKLSRLGNILPQCDAFEDVYEKLPMVEISLADANPLRLEIKWMPEVNFSLVGPKFKVDALASFIALDIETTGLLAKNDYIVELSAVRFDEYEPAEAFSTLVKPPINIPEDASKVNHITDDMVSDAPAIEKIMPAFIEFCGSIPIVGHNLPFDLKFLHVNGFDLSIKRKYFDTLSISKRIDGLSCPDYKLDSLAAACNVYRDIAHRALSDALATGYIFGTMVRHITEN